MICSTGKPKKTRQPSHSWRWHESFPQTIATHHPGTQRTSHSPGHNIERATATESLSPPGCSPVFRQHDLPTTRKPLNWKLAFFTWLSKHVLHRFAFLLSPMLEIGSISVSPLSSKKEPAAKPCHQILQNLPVWVFCLNPWTGGVVSRYFQVQKNHPRSSKHVINQLVISRSSFVAPRTSTPTGNSISV